MRPVLSVFAALLMAGAVSPASVSRLGTRASSVLSREGTIQASSSDSARELLSGAPVEREINPGDSHSYRLRLSASQHAHISVRQRGIDVSIVVFRPDAQRITEIDSHYGLQETEHIYLVAEAAGDYILEVRPVERKVLPGRYEIMIQPPATEDISRFAAQKAFNEGRQLAGERKQESLRKAVDKYQQAFALWKSVGDNEEQARTLNNIGLTYHLLKDAPKAIDYFVQSLPLWKAAGDRSGEAGALYSIGTIYSGIGQRQKGLEYLNQALPLRRAVNDKRWEGETLVSLGRAHEALGEYQAAIESYAQALQIKRDLEDRAGEGVMLFSLGVVDYYQGEYQSALDRYNQSLLVRRDAGDRDGEGSTLSAIGLVHSSRGEFPEALEYYDRAIQLSRDTGNRQAEGLALHNVASVHLFLGDAQKALDCYNQALKLRKEAGDRQGEAQTLSNLGNFYSAQGDQERALEFFNEALPIRVAMGDRRGEAYTINNMGTAHLLQGENGIALDYFNQALSIFQTIRDRDGQPLALIGIGKTYSAFGDHDKALDSYGRALTLFRASGSRRLEGDTLERIGSDYVLLRADEKALSNYNQAIAIAQAIGSRDLEARSLAGLARVESSRNQLADARAHIEAALDITESLRVKIASQDLRTSFLASKQNDYELYVDLLMRLHKTQPAVSHDGAALLASERARARSLLELLTEARADIRQGIESPLLERERHVQQQLNARSEGLTRLLSGKHTDQQAEAARNGVNASLAEYREVQGQIRARSPRYAALTQPAPLTLKVIQQQLLDPETMLLEYSLGKERSYVWAVARTSIKSFELPGRAQIEAAAGRFHELVSQGDKIELRGQVRLAGQNLSRLILAPVAAELSNQRLLIVADGALQYIPFGALPKPVLDSQQSSVPLRSPEPGNKNRPQAAAPRSPSDYRPLIVDHETIALPSASVLTLLRGERGSRQAAAKQVAILADPVLDDNDSRVRQTAGGPTTENRPNELADGARSRKELTRSAGESGVSTFGRLRYTRNEADAIIALAAPGTGMEALDFEASKATATGGRLSQYRIVHFATHGLINSRHPELSGIVLSLVDQQGRPQDGFLRLHDVYNLKLDADLVVLSGCRTAVGKDVRGEGLIGLTRGFMYAGAPRVVASLWDVRDEATAELMKRFYEAMLRQRMPPAAALRAAQLSMTREKRWEAPYYWAGFVLQGEWR